MNQKKCFSWVFIGLAVLAVFAVGSAVHSATLDEYRQVATIPIPLTNRVSEAASLFSAWC